MVKGQLVADVLNSQHTGTGATWRINTKILLSHNNIMYHFNHLVAFEINIYLSIYLTPPPGE